MAFATQNSQITKNTIVLYFRMILTLGVGLYTVRMVLKILGVEDYGIYNVVGGTVSLLSFVVNSMASASQRYLSFELGREDYGALKGIFNLSMYAYIGIALGVLLLCETIGLWFLNTQMTISSERISAANWVYQSAIFSFIVSIMTTPYISAIFSNEKMTVYGYIAIIEVSLKLIIVYLLGIIYYDKLKIYALLMFFSQVTISSFYIFYSRKHFKECRLSFYWNKSKMKEILSFSTWSMIGSLAGAMRSQGLNVLINIFFNPAINAARGVAFQMQAAVNGLRVNFYNAVSPQVVKLYSSEHHEKMMDLVFMSSKLAFFLIMFFSVPMLIETPYILHLWLGTVPEYSILFTRLVIIELTIDIFNNPLDNALGASGRVRSFQIWVSSLYLLVVPLSYLALKIAEYPEIPFVISILVSVLCFFPRLYFVHKFVAFPVRQYLWKVVWVGYRVLIIASLPPLICYVMMKDDNFYRLITVCITSCISSAFCIYWLGLNQTEQMIVKKYVAKLPYLKSL